MNTSPSAFLLQCPPIPNVRIALIGLGKRGMKTLIRYAYIQHAEIRCIVDVASDRLEAANEALLQSGRPKADALCGTDAWKEACQRTDIDLVYICTEWSSHAAMCIHAMECGKHVAVEVPAATTVKECLALVETAERTQRHCFMTENCCYDFFALNTLEMNRRGLFGEITHCEGAYIHDLTPESADMDEHTANGWIERSCLLQGGNPYPTHGIGPIGQLLGFHRRDRMHHLVSITSAGSKQEKLPVGRVNSTLIQTVNGVSILLQLDVTTHRPYSRMQTVCGTRAFAQKYPTPSLQVGTESWSGEEALARMDRYAVSDASRLWKEGVEKRVPNAMNYAMDARLIHCLNHGLSLDMDVYDAAEWSCLVDLTRQSALQGGMPVEVPDFMNRDSR